MAANTRTLITLVAGLGAVVVLASGASASAPARPVGRPSTRRPPRARSSSSSAPAGDVTLGPITQVITDAKTGKVTRKTDPSSLTAAEKAKYVQEAARTHSLDESDYALLTPEQAEALESSSVEAARAGIPGANTTQQELARRAAIKAREAMGKKGVAPIPRAPSNPGVQRDAVPARDDAPKAYVSPPTPINLDLARREAPTLAKHIRTKGSNYSRQSLRDFQSHAGLTVDGIYGPLSASALKYFGVTNPPKALFKAKAGTVTIYAPAN
jgi:peptidoglycan hydrolase-like protein with peptidoglycan-binding domain